MKWLMALAPFLLLVLTGCPPREGTTKKAATEQEGDKTVVKSTETGQGGALTEEKLAEYRKNARQEVEKLEAELAKLKDRAKDASADVRKKLQPQIDALHEQTQAAKKRLNELQQRGVDAWNSARPELENSLKKLREAYRKAVDEFKK
jgi:hypothetical protein